MLSTRYYTLDILDTNTGYYTLDILETKYYTLDILDTDHAEHGPDDGEPLVRDVDIVPHRDQNHATVRVPLEPAHLDTRISQEDVY